MTSVQRSTARALQWTLGLGLLAAGVWVLLHAGEYRNAEAWTMSKVVIAVADHGTWLDPDGATVFVGLHTDHAVGLRIDQLCSTGPIAGLVLIITGGLVLGAGVSLRSALVGLLAMLGIVASVNALRLTALSWSAAEWGLTGWFEWLHLYGGAAATMLAVIVGCALYLRLIRRATPPTIA